MGLLQTTHYNNSAVTQYWSKVCFILKHFYAFERSSYFFWIVKR